MSLTTGKEAEYGVWKCTHRLACCFVWFSIVQSAGCWSLWCQRLCQPPVSKPVTGNHRACGTASDACPASTHGPSPSVYICPSWHRHAHTHKMQQPLTNLFKIFEHSSKICLFGGDFSNHEYFVNAECLSLQLALHLGQHNTMSTVQCHASRVLVNGT